MCWIVLRASTLTLEPWSRRSLQWALLCKATSSLAPQRPMRLRRWKSLSAMASLADSPCIASEIRFPADSEFEVAAASSRPQTHANADRDVAADAWPTAVCATGKSRPECNAAVGCDGGMFLDAAVGSDIPALRSALNMHLCCIAHNHAIGTISDPVSLSGEPTVLVCNGYTPRHDDDRVFGCCRGHAHEDSRCHFITSSDAHALRRDNRSPLHI